MRVLQLIDSLEPGGAERMAVNYANALSRKIEFSGLVSTRKKGRLLDLIDPKVSFLFLKKTKKIDLNSILRLKKYAISNNINVIHAHSSSFFTAILLKLILPKIMIIWHDHYGISQDLSARKNVSLRIGSLFFAGVISVNLFLKRWAESYLFCSNVTYLPNFIEKSQDVCKNLNLKGNIGKRIVCVANLRQQKNHELLIDAASFIKKKYPDWTFHLFGKDFNDEYSERIKKSIVDLELEETIFFYGTINNISSALKQSNIAVLPSLSEGLPLAILEYGEHKLPVVSTNVGQISNVITSEKEGIVIESNNLKQLIEAIEKLILNEKLRENLGQALYDKVKSYSEEKVIEDYLIWLNSFASPALKKKKENGK
ncbi:glycosyltransferase family 4 protein [Flavobacterium quisquiliarum]|uniref:Glycosyltransferase family 4 protein n=1 Tax=Flavobacterium quisquiliarum TaxID=1834436 RepID=A0ABV8WAS1_9FLAO|nr:glycosyltransferase family 4 protein [Flavobacterium quisquiliarum]MBW1657731.1 glycosyltransferase [Flavobacterium quisquiliarum]NWL04070.1 glycosyltransferase [Flavobacterium collinsii]